MSPLSESSNLRRSEACTPRRERKGAPRQHHHEPRTHRNKASGTRVRMQVLIFSTARSAQQVPTHDAIPTASIPPRGNHSRSPCATMPPKREASRRSEASVPLCRDFALSQARRIGRGGRRQWAPRRRQPFLVSHMVLQNTHGRALPTRVGAKSAGATVAAWIAPSCHLRAWGAAALAWRFYTPPLSHLDV